MGNSQSEHQGKETPNISKQKMYEQDALQEERIKNQILQNKLNILQREIAQGNQNHLFKKSNIPLLSNPNFHQEFLKNKKFQQEFINLVKKQKEEYEKKNMNENQYNQINDFLKNLDIETNDSYLSLNQDFNTNRNYNFNQEEKKLNIGNSSQDYERLLELLKTQKQQQANKMKKQQEIRKKNSRKE